MFSHLIWRDSYHNRDEVIGRIEFTSRQYVIRLDVAVTKGPVILDEGREPRRQQQAGREMDEGIGRFSP
jgi:hypothetical protein